MHHHINHCYHGADVLQEEEHEEQVHIEL